MVMQQHNVDQMNKRKTYCIYFTDYQKQILYFTLRNDYYMKQVEDISKAGS